MENIINKLCEMISDVIKNSTLHIYDSWYGSYRDETIKDVSFVGGIDIKVTTEKQDYIFTIDELDDLSEGKCIRQKISTTEVDTYIEYIVIF